MKPEVFRKLSVLTVVLAAVLVPHRTRSLALDLFRPDYRLYPLTTADVSPFYRFLYATTLYYYEQSHDGDEASANSLSFSYTNDFDLVSEWVQYTRGQVPAVDIYNFLYAFPSHGFIGAVDDQLASGQLAPGSLSRVKNQLVTYARQQPDPALFNYLQFCKTIEQAFVVLQDPWGFQEPVTQFEDKWPYKTRPDWQASLASLQAEAAWQATHCPDPWLRRRYAYQQLLLAQYSGHWQLCSHLYNEHFAEAHAMPGLQRWAQMHTGIALVNAGQAAAGNLLLAQAFAYSKDKGMGAFRNFKLAEADAAIKLARTAEERAALWFIIGCKTPAFDIQAIAHLHSLTGYSKLTRLLVLREIGKIDDALPLAFGEQYRGLQDDFMLKFMPIPATHLSRWNIDWSPSQRAHIQRVLDWCEAAAGTPASNNQHEWQLMAAHLNMYLGRYTACRNWLARLERLRNNPKTRQALFIYNTLLITFDQLYTQAGRREAVARQLAQMPAASKNDHSLNELGYLLVKRFEQLNDSAGADLLECIVLNPANELDRQPRLYRAPTAVLEGLQVNRFGLLGRLAVQRYPKIFNQLFTTAAVLALLDEKPAQAAAFFDQANDNEPDGGLPRDPTQLTYFGGRSSNAYPDGRSLTRAEWCRQLATLQKAAPGNFEMMLKVAHCYYNMTWYGNSRAVMVGDWWEILGGFVDREPLNQLPPRYQLNWSRDGSIVAMGGDAPFFLPPHQQLRYWRCYMGAELALKYYQKAQKLAPSREAAAACALMIGRCRYRLIYNNFPLLDADYENSTAVKWQQVRHSYTELFTQYPDLADELVTNCHAWGRFIAVRPGQRK